MDGFISALIKLKGRVLAKGANKKVLLATFNRFWGKYDVDYATRADVVKQVFGSHFYYGGDSWPDQLMSSQND